MDDFVEALISERVAAENNAEDSAEDISPEATVNALGSGIYLPFLPRCFNYPQPGGQKFSEFQNVKADCLNCIHDALLQSDWQRAAELMISYVEILENNSYRIWMVAPEIIWRIGTEILQHHPRSNISEANQFADRIKSLQVKIYLKVCLEHAFQLLCSGFVDEAYQNLVLAESWRYGDQVVLQEKELKLIQGYRGLLDYYKWLKKKREVLSLGQDSYSESSIQQEMYSLYRQAKVSLKEVIKIPGVWDPFVICYVDLLEHYEEYEEAREVLNDYAYNPEYPSNPNAHVYFYEFLKRRGESRKTQISALQVLHELVPSHELMLELFVLLKKTKSSRNHKLRLQVIFEALDFAGWKENVKAWRCLAEQIVEILQSSQKQFDWLKKEWNTRKDWWPAFHFSQFLAKRNWQENANLASEKVLVAGVLLGKDCKYFKYIIQQGCKAKKKKFKPLKKFVKHHSWQELA
uniref:TATA-box binding protein associated factor, RNA polymerase I subunit A n=1 Tax=Salvator merianae TaxID=96440 RepID=A0A8D0DFG7_SALMN